MVRRILALMGLTMAVAGVWPMIGASGVGAQDEPVPVVASFSILADIVQQVGGDHVVITTLVTPNMDAHSFEPSPDQIVGLTDAALIFEIGIGFEPWLDRMVEASRPDAQRVVVSGGVAIRSAEAGHSHDETDETDDHRLDDPHIWHNPLNVVIMTEHIRDALSEVDPDHRGDYEANAARFITQLKDLDRWIAAQIDTIPANRRRMVTSHDTFGYYADHYGLEIIGTPLGRSTSASDPSAGDVARLIDRIRESGVPAIFTENVSNPELMEQIAENAGVALAPPLYTDALGEPGTPGDSYLGLMRYNTETIVAALTS